MSGAIRHYYGNIANASARSWADSDRHHTVYRNHARQAALAWRRLYRIYDRAFLPGRWEQGYWSEDADRRAA